MKRLSILVLWVLAAIAWTAPPLPLRVVGTQLLDSENKLVVLRGVNAASLEWASDGEGHILETVRVAIDDWKSNVVRVPLSQDRWFGHGPEQKGDPKPYRALVRKVVDLCSERGVYVILDLHWSNANEWGKQIGQHQMPDENSVTFWRDIAPLYRNHPAVIFDLYNGPFRVSWDIWENGGMVTEKDARAKTEKTYMAVGMKQLLRTVRATGAKNLVIVGGLDWSYDMTGFVTGHALADPTGNGVVYANHNYPFKGDTIERWIAKMDAVVSQIPVIVSEFGSDPGGGAGLNGGQWVRAVLKYVQERKLSWTAWDLHPAAGPTLISDWKYTPSMPFGALVKEALTGIPVAETRPETLIPLEDLAPTRAKSYDWLARHRAVVDRIRQSRPELILVGDSITHMWGGDPAEGGNNGPGSGLFASTFGAWNTVNLGFGWDRTQHVLWRFENGELENIRPRAAVVMIGTNNVGTNSTADIAEGITAIVEAIRRKSPRTQVLLFGIFPRDEKPGTPNRKQVAEINERISALGKRPGVTYMDIGAKFLEPDGTISKEIMPDFLHPSPKGYAIWAAEMKDTLARLMAGPGSN